MSITHLRHFNCARCDSPIKARVAQSVNAGRHPHMRRAILRRIFHLFACQACEAPNVVETDFLYIDFERRQFFGVFPPEASVRARACAEQVVSAFEQAFASAAAKRSGADGGEFQVRVCFGLEELREKILAAEEGLDDLTLEALKADVLAAREGLQRDAVQTLRLDSVDPASGDLHFLTEIGGEPPHVRLDRMVIVERALYDAVDRPWTEILEARPYLASGPHVSVLRALTWSPL